MSKLVINGIEYVPAADAVAKPTGQRAVVVVDRGWIFAGDVTQENGRIKLSRAVWVFRWSNCGFNGVIANPKSDEVELRRIADVDLPEAAEIFRVPVADDWGL